MSTKLNLTDKLSYKWSVLFNYHTFLCPYHNSNLRLLALCWGLPRCKKNCEVFLCFVTIMFVLSIVLTSLFSLFYVTCEGDRFLNRGWAIFCYNPTQHLWGLCSFYKIIRDKSSHQNLGRGKDLCNNSKRDKFGSRSLGRVHPRCTEGRCNSTSGMGEGTV